MANKANENSKAVIIEYSLQQTDLKDTPTQFPRIIQCNDTIH